MATQASRICAGAFVMITFAMKQRVYRNLDRYLDKEGFEGTTLNALRQNDYKFYASTVGGIGATPLYLVNSQVIFGCVTVFILGCMFCQHRYIDRKDKIITTGCHERREWKKMQKQKQINA